MTQQDPMPCNAVNVEKDSLSDDAVENKQDSTSAIEAEQSSESCFALGQANLNPPKRTQIDYEIQIVYVI